ncbi:MutS family DNA mismatch repair protein [Bacteroides fragilis]|uniref:MutS family DNA mismatch repair protein n=1 Tax=Bacteroides fragilis TaxID=817 RepID=UPI0004BC6716|nr:MutS family DNA mismatch repair protein [Bacteroides fragilis]
MLFPEKYSIFGKSIIGGTVKKLRTDRQTLNDLGIVESTYGEKTLFSLFDMTESDGGKRCLEEWLGHPLSDWKALHERQEAIRYPDFPEIRICREELDFIEFYLSQGDRPTRVSYLESAFSYIFRHFRATPERYVIRRGTKLLENVLLELKTFADHVTALSPRLIRNIAATISEIYQATELGKMVDSCGQEDSFYRTDRLDYIFRYRRNHTIAALLSIVYQLDAIRTVHRTAVTKGWCFPSFTNDSKFMLCNFYHPQVKDAVANDWEMENGNICIFTGSNMAGKSTTLKAIASAVWLAHAGFPVPASSMVCPMFDGIFTSINLPDSLRDGRSYFYAEVLRVKEVLEQINKGHHCFVLFDELFRGTNARDAFEASVAVAEVLKAKAYSRFLISTHIIELARKLDGDDACCFYYLESAIVDDELICNHKVKPGISESRVGYWIVKKELAGFEK